MITPAQYWISCGSVGGGFGKSLSDELGRNVNRSTSENTFVCRTAGGAVPSCCCCCCCCCCCGFAATLEVFGNGGGCTAGSLPLVPRLASVLKNDADADEDVAAGPCSCRAPTLDGPAAADAPAPTPAARPPALYDAVTGWKLARGL